ncbi:MAG TPA: M15 family metallopeptidase [Candidatus Coprovivens excrementavium]|nr:M15 family metallopeptidase [Candidatus Coprovivens excrementavium]
MARKKRKKRLRLKPKVARFLIYFIFFIIMGIYTINESRKIIADFKYRETYEYKITEKGYKLEEAKKLIEILPDEKLNYILDNEYNEMYYNIVSQKYYLNKNFDKYIQYKEYHEDTSYEDVIAIVNVHANAGWYNKSYETNINDGFLIIVNKFYHLDKSYERTDLQNINLAYAYANNSAAEIVIKKFKQMRDDIEEEMNVHLMVNSSYRSYEDQEEIYNEFKKVSLKYADSYAARPGYSEHQTGLAIDITSLEHPTANEFKESEEYKWLKENCHKYGFVLRYPEGKEHITGYSTESWHFRYIGEEAATQIYKENITFDEYYAYYIEK